MKITRLRAASDALSALRAAPTRRTSLSRGQHSVQQPCRGRRKRRRQSRRVALLRTEVCTENGSREAIYLAILLLLSVVRAGKTRGSRLPAWRSGPRRYAPQLCHSKRTRLKKPLEKYAAITRVEACHDSTLSHSVVWPPAWRVTAQQERKCCRRGSLLTLRLSPNAKNEQQSSSHKTSDTAARGPHQCRAARALLLARSSPSQSDLFPRRRSCADVSPW